MVKEKALIKDIMIREVAIIPKSETVTHAARLMSSKNIGSVLVVDDDDLIGIVTEKDLLKKVVSLGRDSNTLKVQDIMTKKVLTISPESDIFTGNKIMNENGFRRLPVVLNDKILGIVTQRDIARELLKYEDYILPKKETSTTNILKKISHTYDMSDTECYLFIEENPKKIYDAFIGLITKQYEGLCVTRTIPDKIKKEYGLSNTNFIWLTEMAGSNCINPTETEKLKFTIKSFIKKSEKSVIMIDGLEYIQSYTSFNEMFHLIESLIDAVAISNSILILTIDKETFDNKEYHLLERGIKVLE